jgi:hypothetical protein
VNRWECTYLWWEGSATSTSNGQLCQTTPPIGEEVMEKLNALGAEGWEIGHITATPLTTGWISPEVAPPQQASATRSTTWRCCAARPSRRSHLSRLGRSLCSSPERYLGHRHPVSRGPAGLRGYRGGCRDNRFATDPESGAGNR